MGEGQLYVPLDDHEQSVRRVILKATAYRIGSLLLARLILGEWGPALAVIVASTAWYVVIELSTREQS